MKTNKLVKLGIATFAVAVLGVVPAFTAQADTNVAEQPNTAQADTHVAEQPNTASKPVENGKPSDSEKPEVKPVEEVKPEPKPSETPKPEVKPEPAPKADENQEPIKYRINYFDADTGSEISKELGVLNPGETINTHKNIDGYEVVTKRSWMPDYNVDYRLMNRYFGYSTDGYRYIYLDYKKVNASETPKPEPAPKTDENKEPIKYRIDYFNADTGERLSREIGVLSPGETINIHKNIDGYEVVTKRSWMPDYNVDYRLMDRYFGSTSSYRYMFLEYKKVNADAKPSETPKPEVKPEPAPKDKEQQKPLKYFIDYLDEDTGEQISHEIGVLKPGETINIYKDIEGYEVVSYYGWMPGYKVNYRIMNTYFGFSNGYDYMFLRYKKVKPETKPSDTSKPEVKPETKPSETPKPVTPAVPDQPQPAKPEKPVTPSTSRILANEIGSVQVRASEETLKNVSYIKVEETKSNSLEAKNYKAYDIRLYDANGKAVQPNGMVLVSLSAEKPVENVYYVSPDGALQALDFKQDADKVTFETNHFSIYAMTFKNMSVNHNGGSIQTPAAGSENPTIPTQNSNGADGTQPQSKPLKTKGEGGEKTRKTLPNTGENSSILTTLFGVLTLNAGLFSYRKKEK